MTFKVASILRSILWPQFRWGHTLQHLKEKGGIPCGSECLYIPTGNTSPSVLLWCAEGGHSGCLKTLHGVLPTSSWPLLHSDSMSFPLRTLFWCLQHIHLFPSEQLEKVQAAWKRYEDRHLQPALDFGAGHCVFLSHDVTQFTLLVGWTTVTWARIELWTNFHRQLPCVCRTHTVVCTSLPKPVNINAFSSTTSNDGSQSKYQVWTVLDSTVL